MVHQNFYFDPFRFAYIYYCIVLVVVLLRTGRSSC